MGKISPVTAKYIIHTNIDIEGVVDRPDIIGAIFGQTEGLLGSELELRELQKSGRIGRIEVNTETRNGKTGGNILLPSSLDKAETSIIGAALEIIQRIGPCNARMQVTGIEDVRVSKRNMVIERAKELLKNMMGTVIPDSQELTDEVASAVRVMEIAEYGKDRLPAGPAIDESDEVIIVEGRADVLNLLKHGFKNAIAMNGTSVPETIIELSRQKVITAFVDGDRGGNLIVKEITNVADIDYVTRAPDGKEVEEITKKEIHKALRSRISGEQAKLELSKDVEKLSQNFVVRRPQQQPFRRPMHQNMGSGPRPHSFGHSPPAPRQVMHAHLTEEQKKTFKKMLEDLIGTRGAQVVDSQYSVLGKVPISELQSALKNLSNAYAVVMDGLVDKTILDSSEGSNVKFLVGMESKIKPNESKISILTVNDL
ncbi:DNA primase [Candidatus Woesearchaeota archaeon]|nr:DNA primase [Candidatus Woesearchaeota archaeon]